MESEIMQITESGIQVPLTRNPDPVLEIQNPQAGIQNPILSLITLHARVTDWLVWTLTL